MSNKEEKKQKKPDMQKRVLVRNGFYWAQYNNILAAIVLAGVWLAVGLVALYHFATFEPPHKYLATTADFKVLVSPPLNEPFIQEGDAIQVATNALRGVYTYDYVNWQDQLTTAQKWFTIQGWNAFGKEFAESGAIQAVIKRGQVVSLKILEAPVVRQKGLANGKFTWVIDFPRVEVGYRAIANKDTLIFNYKVTVDVVRAPLDTSPNGALVNAIRVSDITNSAKK